MRYELLWHIYLLILWFILNIETDFWELRKPVIATLRQLCLSLHLCFCSGYVWPLQWDFLIFLKMGMTRYFFRNLGCVSSLLYNDSLCWGENILLKELKCQESLVSLHEHQGLDRIPASTLGTCVLSHRHELPSDHWYDLPLDPFLRVELGVLGMLQALRWISC